MSWNKPRANKSLEILSKTTMFSINTIKNRKKKKRKMVLAPRPAVTLTASKNFSPLATALQARMDSGGTRRLAAARIVAAARTVVMGRMILKNYQRKMQRTRSRRWAE